MKSRWWIEIIVQSLKLDIRLICSQKMQSKAFWWILMAGALLSSAHGIHRTTWERMLLKLNAAECCSMLLNAGPSKPTPSAVSCMNFCWIISAIGLTWDDVKYVSYKLAALCFGTLCLKANAPKQRAANLMETSNLNFWRTVPEDRHCRQSSLKYQQPLRLKIILPFLFFKKWCTLLFASCGWS